MYIHLPQMKFVTTYYKYQKYVQIIESMCFQSNKVPIVLHIIIVCMSVKTTKIQADT